MTFGNYEASRFSGEPVHLYLFRYGPIAGQFIAYTDAETAIEYDVPLGEDDTQTIQFMPIAIDRGKITSSGTLDKANLTVTTPHDSDLANLFLIYPPSQQTTMVLYQGHVNDVDADFKVAWTGRVTSCARKGSQAEFSCEPVSTSLRRNGCRRRYQYGCPLVLYGDDCRANKAAATASTTVAGLTGNRITLPSGWNPDHPADKYVQGLAEWTTADGAREVRTLLRAENGGVTFLLGGTTRGLEVGAAIDIVLGCNHKSGTDAQPDGDCGPLHNNILNFGGQERIPFKNPIGLVNGFY